MCRMGQRVGDVYSVATTPMTNVQAVQRSQVPLLQASTVLRASVVHASCSAQVFTAVQLPKGPGPRL